MLYWLFAVTAVLAAGLFDPSAPNGAYVTLRLADAFATPVPESLPTTTAMFSVPDVVYLPRPVIGIVSVSLVASSTVFA